MKPSPESNSGEGDFYLGVDVISKNPGIRFASVIFGVNDDFNFKVSIFWHIYIDVIFVE